MENTHKNSTLLVILLLASTTTGGCLPSNEEATSHVWFPGNGDKYYGAEATLDVYGLALGLNQSSQAGIWIANKGDGQPSSMNGIQIGWHISPGVYNDSQTHFFVDWTSAGADKHCLNMLCPGFKKTSSIITPGDVISPVSATNGNKQYVTLKLFKDKSTGDWYVHYGFNGDAKPVGFLPKSFLPGMIDKPVEINFGGLVYHSKPQTSPPMGNGYLPTSGAAATFSSLKLISEDGNGHPVTTNLPIRMTRPSCYPMSWMDAKGGFSYGGPGCAD
ncbi:hypothetical protein EJB05_34260, partial [Eragrostis curvula]